jgi:hypothetical protein
MHCIRMVYAARMTKRVFDKIMASVKEARACLDGTADKSRYRVHTPRKRKTRPLLDAEEKRIQRGIAADPDSPDWPAEDFKRATPFGRLFPVFAKGRRSPRPHKTN